MRELLRSFYLRAIVLPRIHRAYRGLSTSETFSRIYATREWGEGSGNGSEGITARQYVDDVCAFIRKHNIKSVVDLGCGDFRVGRELISRAEIAYIGVDIVPSLIEQHSKTFASERVSFRCANLAIDPLPMAELCLVRQVFQHLSNDEIASALDNISKYPMALISEHIPKSPKSFNRDKPHGPDVRVYWGSGVYVDQPPFSRTISDAWERELDRDSLLRTVLLT